MRKQKISPIGISVSKGGEDVKGIEPIGEKDVPQAIQVPEDFQRLLVHLLTLEQSKLDALFTLLGIRRK